MARRLVFVPGRAQEGRGLQALVDAWIHSLRKGLAKSNLPMPVDVADIRFPSYGNALADRMVGTPGELVAQIIVKGRDAPPQERDFMLAVLRQVAAAHGITEGEVQALAGSLVIEEEDRNWASMQRILHVLEMRLSAASTAAIVIAARDSYQYLFDRTVADAIDDGVRAAMQGSAPAVVVSHSLGTVVAFMMLNEIAPGAGWKVPLFVTLGSPLAVTVIRRRLMPLKHPACVGKWFNAMDPRDVVALHPLYGASFPVDRRIENKIDVENSTDDHHGIAGYLEDPVVARRIHDALVSESSAAIPMAALP